MRCRVPTRRRRGWFRPAFTRPVSSRSARISTSKRGPRRTRTAGAVRMVAIPRVESAPFAVVEDLISMSRSSRRAFLGTLGAAAAAVPALRSTTLGAGLAGPPAAAGQAAASYDLLIKGGRVIDPSQKLNGALDVAISGGKIAAVSANIPANRAREVFDAAGKLVT